MYFVGIDLAWSEINCSGVVVLKGNKTKAEFVCGEILHSDQDMIDYIKKNTEGECFVAIDAPLIVPNEEGRRVAEAEVWKLFRKYNAGAHPSNRPRLGQWNDGRIRGEELSKALEKESFMHSPYIKKFEKSRKFFEVYPHPSIVVIFGLDQIIKYKAKPKRDYEFRWNEFEKYQKHLQSLKDLDLPAKIIKKSVRDLKARKLKNYEDLLDGIMCGYIAYYSWKRPSKCAVLGDMKEGYIITPIFDKMREQKKLK